MQFIVKISVFWDVTPCSGADMYGHFGGTDCLNYLCAESCILHKEFYK